MSNAAVVRESPVLAALAHGKPKWGELNDMRVITGGDHRRAGEELVIADVSALAKLGLKGRGAAAWLEKHGINVPGKIYEYSTLPGGGLFVRTGGAEFFIEDAPGGETVARLTESLSFNPPDVYPVWRQDASFVLAGRNSIEVLAQTCGYNFRDGGDAFIYSRVAGVSCAILKQSPVGVPTFRFWCDCSFGFYLWEELVQIVHELSGEVAGFNEFFPNSALTSGGPS